MAFDFRLMRSLIFVDCIREEYRHKLQNWLYCTHIQDSIAKFGPYVTKYAFYNALPTPPEGKRFGTRTMQMTEHYWMINELLPEMRNVALSEWMPPEVMRWQGIIPDIDPDEMGNLNADDARATHGGENPPFVFAHVPINWQEDFKGAGRTYKDGPNYRWQFVVQWPDEEAGEKWFHEVMVPFFTQRPEVTRMVSSRIYQDVLGCPFHRLVEVWFDGPEEWYEAAVAGTESMEKPEWAQQEQFPFLRPNFNIVSMFVTDIPNVDCLTQWRGFLPMR